VPPRAHVSIVIVVNYLQHLQPASNLCGTNDNGLSKTGLHSRSDRGTRNRGTVWMPLDTSINIRFRENPSFLSTTANRSVRRRQPARLADIGVEPQAAGLVKAGYTRGRGHDARERLSLHRFTTGRVTGLGSARQTRWRWGRQTARAFPAIERFNWRPCWLISAHRGFGRRDR
jgi:hypothetical protein